MIRLAVVKCFNKRLSLLFPSGRQIFLIGLPLLLQCSLIFKAVNLTGLYRKAFCLVCSDHRTRWFLTSLSDVKCRRLRLFVRSYLLLLLNIGVKIPFSHTEIFKSQTPFPECFAVTGKSLKAGTP